MHGVAFEQSFVLGRRWSLHLEEEIGVTGLDFGDGRVTPAVDASIRLALEVAL